MTVQDLSNHVIGLTDKLEKVIEDMKQDRITSDTKLETLFTKLTTSINGLATIFSESGKFSVNGHAHSKGPLIQDGSSGSGFTIRAGTINLKFPVFDGDDAEGWIFQAEQYYTLHDVPDAQRIPLAAVHFKGDANSWYRWIKDTLVAPTWEQFSSKLRSRFGSRKHIDPCSSLSKLSQQGIVRELITEFEKLLNFVYGIPEEHLVSIFISALRSDIGTGVRLFLPKTLSEAFDIALRQEDAITATKAFSASKPWIRSVQPKALGTITSPNSQKNGLPPGVKRLSWMEQKERREKGLCFNCDKLYKPGHLCEQSRLLFLEGAAGVTITELDCIGGDDKEITAEQDKEIQTTPGISLHALMGSLFPNTMRITGHIKGKPITVLIESGSTHNFLHPTIAKQCGYSIQSNDAVMRVMIGDGGFLQTSGSCDNVSIKLQNYSFSTEFFLLAISGCDAVLGVQWLQTLGAISWDFNKLHMKFCVSGTEFILVGENSPTVMLLDHTPMQRLIHREQQGILLQLSSLPPDMESSTLSQVPSEITELIFRFSDVFGSPTYLPPTRSHDHRIPLIPNSAPVNVRPYRYPHFQKEEIEKIVSELKNAGFIRPSTSPYSSPVLLVQKKDGSWRMCVDYRALNKITVKDRFPIPMVDELLDELHGKQVFSKVDMRYGFHQLRAYEPDIHKTTFRTHDGHYEFLVMPFGLSNAPATFQSLMNDIFRPYLRKFVLVFFDDMLVYSNSMAEHIKHLELVFETLRSNKLFLKESKCDFAKSSIGYLGHMVSADGVSVENDKIASIVNWPTPSSIKDLRGFLGLAGYYRKFVKDYGKISAPLTQLLKRNAFSWSELATKAFKQLQSSLTTTPVLALPYFTKEFTLECDASGNGLGAILMQSGRPIAFYSKPLSGKNLNLSFYDKEMLDIVSAVQKWRPYLLGRHFKIYTYHRSLKYFLDQRLSSIEQQKWLSKLLGYDYEIFYRCGAANKAADALSRVSDAHLLAITAPIFSGINDIIRECHHDNEFSFLIEELHRNPNYKPPYSYIDGILRYKGRVVVVSTSTWCTKLLHEFHATPLGGHSGFLRTYKRLQRNFYWKGMKRSIKTYIAQCDICQRNKSEDIAPPGLLQPLPIPEDVWMDFQWILLTDCQHLIVKPLYLS
ncbi:uncharacterized protein LOC113277692 [Papaver somniferum]|uniref:uncharacterized protein LOC113277692 n=1 Tax=Papaver somniferum TaxID=3469 RepID=UPI000E6F627B|nr:uncharacterized protein LOC113277692 [Papaver somniferum]